MDWKKFNKLKVLIIDDDQFTRELIRTMLKNIPNIIIDQAVDGVEALRILDVNEYDMLFLDLHMPKMSGEEFIRKLRRNNESQKTPFIVLITTDRLNKEERKNIGVDYYITKPFDFSNFLNNIYKILEEVSYTNET